MWPYEDYLRLSQKIDLRQHMHKYENTLNRNVQLSPYLFPMRALENGNTKSFESIGICHDDDVAEVAIYISNEMKANLNAPICAMIQKHNKRAVILLASNNKILAASHKAKAYLLWMSVVKKNAIWDYKKFMLRRWGEWACNKKKKDALRFNYDIWGNINYGFIGKHVGFSDWELLSGAGVAQTWDNKMTKEEIQEKLMKDGLKGLDDPKDQTAIKIGFDLFKNHKGDLLSILVIDKLEKAYLKGEAISVEECNLNHYKSFY